MAAILLLSFSLPCFADGDGNIDSGGGDMGSGSGTNIWHIGDDGVRITIVNAKTQKIASSPIDFTNTSFKPNFWAGANSKISYRNGKNFNLKKSNNYCSVNPSTPIPQIVSPSGAVNIEAVKNYFCTAGTAKDIAEKTGFNYDKLISGDYKLLLEPIAYFTYNNITFAMTAHEASLYDQITNGDLFKQMGHLTRKNLPLAMFLETADLGFPAWEGCRNGFVSNSEIQSSLGVGVVRFADTPPDGGDGGTIETPDYKYHTDIDVYTSFSIYSRGGEVSPDDGGRVRINIGGKVYNQSYVCPSGDSQLIWVKWHTPKEPQTIPISISVSGGGSVKKANMKAEITNVLEVEPPDTHSTDMRPNGWKVPRVPKKESTNGVNWGYWTARWHEHWVRVRKGRDKDGKPKYKWEDHGWWDYDWNSRSTNISKASLKVIPDEFCPTATKHANRYEMKSGYGVQLEATASIIGNGEHTKAQNASATFPEFKYATYNRLFKEKKRNTFVLKNNRYAYNPAPVHFIPLWYPDESKYEPQVEVFDIWTPGGVLNAYCSDYVNIDGDCYDDWTIGPKKNG